MAASTSSALIRLYADHKEEKKESKPAVVEVKLSPEESLHKRYYPNEESLLHPLYGFQIMYCRSLLISYLINNWKESIKLEDEQFEILVFATAYYRSPRSENFFNDATLMKFSEKHIRWMEPFLDPDRKNDNACAVILQFVFFLTSDFKSLISPELFRSCFPRINFQDLENTLFYYTKHSFWNVFVSKGYTLSEIKSYILIYIVEQYFEDFNDFDFIPLAVFPRLFPDLYNIVFSEKSSLLEELLTLFLYKNDQNAQKVLNQYQQLSEPKNKNGVYISTIPQTLIKTGRKYEPHESVKPLLIPNKTVTMLVRPLFQGIPCSAGALEKVFFIFDPKEIQLSERDTHHLTDAKKLNHTRCTMSFPNEHFGKMFIDMPCSEAILTKENIIGVGFYFDESTENYYSILSQMISCALLWQVPMFVYHPYIGLCYLEGWNAIQSLNNCSIYQAPFYLLDRKLCKNNIIYQGDNWKIDSETLIINSINTVLNGISFSYKSWLGTAKILNGIPVISRGKENFLDKKGILRDLFNRSRNTINLDLKKIIFQLSYFFLKKYGANNVSVSYYLVGEEGISWTLSWEKYNQLRSSFLRETILGGSFYSLYLDETKIELFNKVEVCGVILNIFSLSAKVMNDLSENPSRGLEWLLSMLSINCFRSYEALFQQYLQQGESENSEDFSSLSLFLKIHLKESDFVSNEVKSNVVIKIMDLFQMQLKPIDIAYCLLWHVKIDKLNAFRQLELKTIEIFISRLRPHIESSYEITQALLVLNNIKLDLESVIKAKKHSLPLHPPLPPPSCIDIESKLPVAERKASISNGATEPAAFSASSFSLVSDRILWGGKELTHASSLNAIIPYVLQTYYLVPYPGKIESAINRPLHGALHALMTAILIELFEQLFYKYLEEKVELPILSDKEKKLVQLMGVYHDSANIGEEMSPDQTPHANNFYRDMIKLKFEEHEVEQCRIAMINKDNKETNIEENKGVFFKAMLQCADCLEILRCIHVSNFDIKRLDLYNIILRYAPENIFLFIKEMTSIVTYYSKVIVPNFYNKLQKIFEDKRYNTDYDLYLMLQNSILYYRWRHAIHPDKFDFSFPIFIITDTSFFSQYNIRIYFNDEEKNNNKIITMYEDKLPRLLPFPLTPVLDRDLSEFKLSTGYALIRGLRRQHLRLSWIEEHDLWTNNQIVLRRESISTIDQLRRRYCTNPLLDFRFRPATMIFPSAHVNIIKSSWLYIMLNPSEVLYWAGAVQNLFTSLWKPEDFNCPDYITKKKDPAGNQYTINAKIFKTVEPLISRLQELNAQRTGKSLDGDYKHYGKIILPSNEVLLMTQKSLLESILALGICCDLTSSNWCLDVIDVAQEILEMSRAFPWVRSMQFFLYIPGIGLYRLSMQHIYMCAIGNGEVIIKNIIMKILKNYISIVSPISLKNIDNLEITFIPHYANRGLTAQRGCYQFTLEGETVRTAMMNNNLPYVEYKGNHYLDFQCVYHRISRRYLFIIEKNVENLLEKFFYWELFIDHSIQDLKLSLQIKHEQTYLSLSFSRDKKSLRYRMVTIVDLVNSVLSWLKCRLRIEKLESISIEDNTIKLLLPPQILLDISGVLQKKLQKLLEPPFSLGAFKSNPTTIFHCFHHSVKYHKYVLSRDALLHADPMISIIGLERCFYKIISLMNTYGWPREEIINFTSLLWDRFLKNYSDSEIMHRWVYLLSQEKNPQFLLQFLSLPVLEKASLREHKQMGEILYEAISNIHRYKNQIEEALIVVTRHMDLFSAIQLSDMLWAFVWNKTDLTSCGLKGLNKLKTRLVADEKEIKPSIKMYAMRDFLEYKCSEIVIKEIKGEDKHITSGIKIFDKGRRPRVNLDEVERPPKRVAVATATAATALL